MTTEGSARARGGKRPRYGALAHVHHRRGEKPHMMINRPVRWIPPIALALMLLTALMPCPGCGAEPSPAWVLWEKQPTWWGLTTRYVVVQASPTHAGCVQWLQSRYYGLFLKGEADRWHDNQTFLCLPQGVRP